MSSSLINVWDRVQELVEELIPEGRDRPRYRALEQQADAPGVSLHRMFWFEWEGGEVMDDRGKELSEFSHTFQLRMFFDFQRYEKRSFERMVLNETTALWRTIESNDQWGEGVRAVWVNETLKERLENNDVIISIDIGAMCDETGGTLSINGEVPSGTIDGVNDSFTLQNVPRPSSLLVFKNGLAMRLGVDYALSGMTITFLTGQVPTVDSVIWVKYQSA